jgi:hypothetical protein
VQLEVLEGSRTLHNKGVHCKQSIKRTYLSRQMRGMGNVEGMEEKHTKCLSENPDKLKCLDRVGKKIVKRIFKKPRGFV